MPLYNLLEYNPNYSDATDSSWFYSKDETTNFGATIVNIDDFKYFKYNTKLLRNTKADGLNGILSILGSS